MPVYSLDSALRAPLKSFRVLLKFTGNRCPEAPMSQLIRVLLLLAISIFLNSKIRAAENEPILRIDPPMHAGVIMRIGISGDQQMLASGSVDKTVRLWSLPGGRLLRTLRVPIG